MTINPRYLPVSRAEIKLREYLLELSIEYSLTINEELFIAMRLADFLVKQEVNAEWKDARKRPEGSDESTL